MSRLDAPEVAEVTKHVKKSVVHVKQHLSAFMAASILASAAGFEDYYEQEDKQQGSSVKTMILFCSTVITSASSLVLGRQ